MIHSPVTASSISYTRIFRFQRSIDTASGSDAKKARWPPSSFRVANEGNGGNIRNAFTNHSYGSQSSLS